MMPADNDFRPLLRDGVDVYLVESDVLVFVFLATRRRIQVKVATWVPGTLMYLDGSQTISQLLETHFGASEESTRRKSQFLGFVDYLVSRSIVVSSDWQRSLPFPVSYIERLSRQFDYLLDTSDGVQGVIEAQRRVSETTIAIIGLGGVGSWFAKLLSMVGFQKFILIDASVMPKFGIGRDANYRESMIGNSRVEVAKGAIQAVDPEATITARKAIISPDANLDYLLAPADVIINCADEPYIGYINVLLSRYVIKTGKSMLAGGGFDAHLASFGEMIVPGETPCADCYTQHFKRVLADWKPVQHPVVHRADGAGGLASLSVFAAAQGVLMLLRYLWHVAELDDGRSEFLFDSYFVDRIKVQRDPFCLHCSEVN